ncbi:MAG: hypothetical protein C0432_03775 [Candidatus Puniceispirillum sp.]|nr:hypothetical protein [Candidatus Pelagibacter sp.]MBA4283394.1 hypothetical protein [Candidatus Puniceispirillum sp.]
MDQKKRGGARQGAGRKINSGQFGEKTKTIRIPSSKEKEIKEYIKGDFCFDVPIPYSNIYVSAGEPFSFEEDEKIFIDINKFMKNNHNTVAITVSGDSMIGLGIFDGDLALIKKNENPKSKDIVIAYVNGGYTLKQYVAENDSIFLKAHHPDVSDIQILPGSEITIFGVLKSIIRRYL